MGVGLLSATTGGDIGLPDHTQQSTFLGDKYVLTPSSLGLFDRFVLLPKAPMPISTDNLNFHIPTKSAELFSTVIN